MPPARRDPPLRDIRAGLLPAATPQYGTGGTAGTHSVNVFRSQSPFRLFPRRLTHRRPTGSPALRTSRGRVIDPGVRLVKAAPSRYTRDVVEVTHRAGQVRLRPRVHSLRA